MLIQFNVENYKSFKDRNSLDLTANGNIRFLDERVAEFETFHGKDRILTVGAILGANMSGKSNLIEALELMRNYVLYSVHYGKGRSKEIRDFKKFTELLWLTKEKIKVMPFRFQEDSFSTETELEVYFNDLNTQSDYNYGFVVQNKKVIEEWLFVKKFKEENYTEIFHRDGERISFKGLGSEESSEILSILEPEILIVTIGKLLEIDILEFISNWFEKLTIINHLKTDPEFNHNLAWDVVQMEEEKSKFIHYIHSFDDSVVDFTVNRIEPWTDLYITREVNGIKVSSSYREESSGFKKMLALYPYFKEALETGGTLIVDDLDSNLHPLMLRFILHAFLTEELNPKRAQLIGTIHDPNIFKQLRRDEIWFVNKNEKTYASSLYSLSQIRNSERDEKQNKTEINYLIGYYGAIPVLKPMEIVKSVNE